MTGEAVDAQRKVDMFAQESRRGPRRPHGPYRPRKKTNQGHDQYAPANVAVAPENSKPETVERLCLKCDRPFLSEGPHNRLCRHTGCVGSRSG